MIDYPSVRLLEPIPFESEGKHLVVLRDPYRFVDEPLTVSVPVYVLLTLMDGTRNIAEIQKQFREQFGGQISTIDLEKLTEELDEHGLLDTPRFQELRQSVLDEFDSAPVRHASHAGTAYERDPKALRAQLDGFYKDLPPTPDELAGASIQGLIAPHIDPRVGGRCAAKAFATLKGATPPPELFVIFGTAHQPSGSLHLLTEKSFETPLGTVQVDRAVAQALQQGCPFDLKRDEYLHKHEHSIEFQIIFLQHLFPERRQFQILPILVGSFFPLLQANTPPMTCEPVRIFSEALKSALRDSGKRVCLVAGADLSHMGRKFGDEQDLSDAFIEETRASDREMLARIEACDKDAFFEFMQADGDKHKVCGLPPIYTMLSILGEGSKGKLLDYDLNVEEETQSFVSFASMAFYR